MELPLPPLPLLAHAAAPLPAATAAALAPAALRLVVLTRDDAKRLAPLEAALRRRGEPLCLFSGAAVRLRHGGRYELALVGGTHLAAGAGDDALTLELAPPIGAVSRLRLDNISAAVALDAEAWEARGAGEAARLRARLAAAGGAAWPTRAALAAACWRLSLGWAWTTAAGGVAPAARAALDGGAAGRAALLAAACDAAALALLSRCVPGAEVAPAAAPGEAAKRPRADVGAPAAATSAAVVAAGAANATSPAAKRACLAPPPPTTQAQAQAEMAAWLRAEVAAAPRGALSPAGRALLAAAGHDLLAAKAAEPRSLAALGVRVKIRLAGATLRAATGVATLRDAALAAAAEGALALRMAPEGGAQMNNHVRVVAAGGAAAAAAPPQAAAGAAPAPAAAAWPQAGAVGVRLLAKMGWKDGLGPAGAGAVAPLEGCPRPKGLGMGFVEPAEPAKPAPPAAPTRAGSRAPPQAVMDEWLRAALAEVPRQRLTPAGRALVAGAARDALTRRAGAARAPPSALVSAVGQALVPRLAALNAASGAPGRSLLQVAGLGKLRECVLAAGAAGVLRLRMVPEPAHDACVANHLAVASAAPDA
jgi:hypothetical protein